MPDQSCKLDYRRVAKAIQFLRERFRDQPTLDDVGKHLGMSPYHVQRLFKRWAGVSPKKFLQYVTLEHAKELLRRSDTVLEASYGAGLSGPGRLHDLFVTIEAVTPGEFRNGGCGLELGWGVHPTPFGDAFFAATDRGLTALAFLREGRSIETEGMVARLREEWPRANVRLHADRTASIAEQIFGEGGPYQRLTTSPAIEPATQDGPALRLHVRGTNFQLRVWNALLAIPHGAGVTYADVAQAIGEPRAARAVGQAVARNPVAVIIPCHRVLRSGGLFGNYRWGQDRKRAILAWEASQLDSDRGGAA